MLVWHPYSTSWTARTRTSWVHAACRLHLRRECDLWEACDAMRCDAMQCMQGKAMQVPYAESTGGAAARKVQVRTCMALRCTALASGGLDLLRERATSSKHEQLSWHRCTVPLLSVATSGAGPDSALRGTDALREDRVDRPTGLRWVRQRLVNWPEGTWRSGTASQRRLGTCELAFLALSTAAQLQSSLFPAGTPSRALSPSDV